MNRHYSHYLIYFLLVLCTFVSKANSLEPLTYKLDTLIVADLNPIQAAIFEQTNELKKGKTVKKITGNTYLTDLYTKNNFSPLWKSSKNRTDLIQIIEAAYFEGLNPDDYHIKQIKTYRNELTKGKPANAKNMAIADILMTNALLTYSAHLVQGKVDPTGLDPTWNYNKRSFPDASDVLVLNKLENETLLEGIETIKTTIPLYKKLKYWFSKYDSINKAGDDLKQIEYPGSSLRIGDSSKVVSELKIHFNTYGVSSENTNPIFDEELEFALKEFQLYNGLEDDGIAGKKTFDALNLSVKERMNIIKVNLERCRWLDSNLPADYLLVNIADFNLYLWRNNEIIYKSRVVVGKEKHETPVFTSKIKYIVFNPTWTLPYSIASKETLPKLKKDPHYLSKNNMTLLRNGTIVNPSTINFKEYSTNTFPFTVIQEPGLNNALGQVKFIFPNKYSVYLHDTPSKSFFNRNERAFSHGCIRVQNPLTLAEYLLKDQNYDQGKIQEVLETKKITEVNLKKPLPVMLMYWTCYENQIDNRLYFFTDVYNRDKKLLQELNRVR